MGLSYFPWHLLLSLCRSYNNRFMNKLSSHGQPCPMCPWLNLTFCSFLVSRYLLSSLTLSRLYLGMSYWVKGDNRRKVLVVLCQDSHLYRSFPNFLLCEDVGAVGYKFFLIFGETVTGTPTLQGSQFFRASTPKMKYGRRETTQTTCLTCVSMSSS